MGSKGISKIAQFGHTGLPNWYVFCPHQVIVSSSGNCVEEHQILKVGDLSPLPLLGHVGSPEQLPRRHQTCPTCLRNSVLDADADPRQRLDHLLDRVLVREREHDGS